MTEQSDKQISVGVLGCTGRVSRLIIAELLKGQWKPMSFAGGTVRPQSRNNGEDIGLLIGHAPIGIAATNDTEAVIERSDVVIDFTTPEATAAAIPLISKHGKAYVVATTGLSAQQEEALRTATNKVPILYTANTSIGVTMLQALVQQVAATLDDSWDIEIMETHHKHKVDAPSGTALALGKAAAKGRGIDHDKQAVLSREGHTGPRIQGNIGYATQRGGDVFGEHSVSFFGEGERIELMHKAHDRSLFAKGSLKAARWLVSQGPGLYSMHDVLNTGHNL